MDLSLKSLKPIPFALKNSTISPTYAHSFIDDYQTYLEFKDNVVSLSQQDRWDLNIRLVFLFVFSFLSCLILLLFDNTNLIIPQQQCFNNKNYPTWFELNFLINSYLLRIEQKNKKKLFHIRPNTFLRSHKTACLN